MTQVSKKLAKFLLTILLSFSFLGGVFVLDTNTSFEGETKIVKIAEAACDPKIQSCPDQPPKTKTKPKSKSTGKSTYDKVDGKVQAEQAKRDAAIAQSNKEIAELKAQEKALRDAGNDIEADQIKEKIQNKENATQALKEYHNKQIEKLQKPAKNKANKELAAANKQVEKKQNAFNKKESELKTLQAEKEAIEAEDPIDPKKLAAINKKIGQKEKELQAAEKALGDAKLKQAQAKEKTEKYEKAPELPNDSDGKDPTKTKEVFGPHIAEKSSLDQFEVSTFLRASGDHKTYINKDGSGIIDFILAAISVLIRIIGSIAIVILIIGGLVLITSGGNEQQLDKGKDIVKYALIGLAVALSAFLIVTFVNNFLSVGIENTTTAAPK